MKTILKTILIKLLEIEARLVLWRFKPRIVAVVGSVGKTTTKDAVHHGLRRFFDARKNDKSFNSEIGTPLTILDLPNAWNNPLKWGINLLKGIGVLFSRYPKWLVLEIGADRPRDIQNVAKWIKTDIVIITRFGEIPVHVEYFDSPKELIAEDRSIIKSLIPDGTLILNCDDADVLSSGHNVSRPIVTYGFADTANVQASNETIIYENGMPVGMSFKVHVAGNRIPLSVRGALGKQHIYPLLAAVATGVALKLNVVELIQALNDFAPPRGRMNVLEGINESVIIDDTYNSSPVAVHEALSVLSSIETSGKRIAALGNMAEIGRYTSAEHRKAGQAAAEKGIDLLVTVGDKAKDIAEGAASLETHSFNTSTEAGEFLRSRIGKGDIVLLKGSQSVRMEKASRMLLKAPERAGELLVRQEKEWQKK